MLRDRSRVFVGRPKRFSENICSLPEVLPNVLHRSECDSKLIRFDFGNFYVEIEVLNEPQMLCNGVKSLVWLLPDGLAPKMLHDRRNCRCIPRSSHFHLPAEEGSSLGSRDLGSSLRLSG